MLSFGIFASGTPFFVMAGLYLFYMLLNLGINLSENPEQTGTADNGSKHIEQEGVWQTAENDPTTYFITDRDFQDDNYYTLCSIVEYPEIWPPPQNCRRCIPDQVYIKENYLFNLYSRPPPVA